MKIKTRLGLRKPLFYVFYFLFFLCGGGGWGEQGTLKSLSVLHWEKHKVSSCGPSFYFFIPSANHFFLLRDSIKRVYLYGVPLQGEVLNLGVGIISSRFVQRDFYGAGPQPWMSTRARYGYWASLFVSTLMWCITIHYSFDLICLLWNFLFLNYYINCHRVTRYRTNQNIC